MAGTSDEEIKRQHQQALLLVEGDGERRRGRAPAGREKRETERSKYIVLHWNGGDPRPISPDPIDLDPLTCIGVFNVLLEPKIS